MGSGIWDHHIGGRSIFSNPAHRCSTRLRSWGFRGGLGLVVGCIILVSLSRPGPQDCRCRPLSTWEGTNPGSIATLEDGVWIPLETALGLGSYPEENEVLHGNREPRRNGWRPGRSGNPVGSQPTRPGFQSGPRCHVTSRSETPWMRRTQDLG